MILRTQRLYFAVIAFLVALILVFTSLFLGWVAPTAYAGTNGGQAQNMTGEPMWIFCNYGEKNHVTLYPWDKGGNPYKSGQTRCWADTDQVMMPHDKRCVDYYFAGFTSRYYMRPGVRYKISGLSQLSVYSTSRYTCTREYPTR